MAQNFAVYNNTNTLVIDDKFSNLMFDHKGTLTIPQGASANWSYEKQVELKNDNTIVVVRPREENVGAIEMYFADKYHIFGHVPYDFEKNKWNNSQDWHVDYYVFSAKEISAPLHGAGMIVYDEKGNIVFSSDQKYMRVIEYNSFVISGYDDFYRKKINILERGRKLAGTFPAPMYYQEIHHDQDIGANFILLDQFAWSRNNETLNASYSTRIVGQVNMYVPQMFATWQAQNFSYLIVDVTGY